MSSLVNRMQSDVAVDVMADEALKDDELVEDMLRTLSPDNRNEDARYISHQALVLLSDQHPERLYDRWDYLADLLKADRAHPKYNAVYILANLTRIDTARKFEGVFRDYFDLLDDKSVVVAAHTAANAGKIAMFKPDLQSRITRELTGKRETGLAAERMELVKGYAIQAMSGYFAESGDKAEILEFVRQCTDSASPKTRKVAKEFLRRFGG